MRRLVAKAVLSIIREDIMMAAGLYNFVLDKWLVWRLLSILCVSCLFVTEDCDAILMVDANNAFNSLNRVVALHNVRQICPPFATILINIYRSPACLFISGEVLMSEEGTTQGDPLAMPLYALATIPLIQQLPSGVEQIWYADDACACGKLGALREWWDRLCELGPSFGYFINAAKTWLVTKDHLFQDSISSFSGSGIRITSNGRPYFGAAIGSESHTILCC